ncbi:MAG: hypothetical protein AAGF85_09115 [Bacteroidota bacterium]
MRNSYLLVPFVFFFVFSLSCKTLNVQDNSSEIDVRLIEYFGDNNFETIWNLSKSYVIGVERESEKERTPGLPKPIQFVVFKLDEIDWIYERKIQDGTVSWHDEFIVKIYDYQGSIDQAELKDNYMLLDVRTKKLSQPTLNEK